LIFWAEVELRTVVKKRVGIGEGCEEVVLEVEDGDWMEERMPARIAVPSVPGEC